MGCFNKIGFVSGLPIEYDDDVMLIFLENRGFEDHSGVVYPTDIYCPVFLPIFGKYDDYGRIEDIESSNVVRYIEDFFGEDIISIVEKVDDNSVGREKNLTMSKNNETFKKLTFGLELKSVYQKLTTECVYLIDNLIHDLESRSRDINPSGERFGDNGFSRIIANHKGEKFIDKTELFIDKIGDKTIKEFFYFHRSLSTLNSKYFPSNYGSQSQDHVLHYKMLSLYRNIIVKKLSRYEENDTIINQLRTEIRDEKLTDVLK